MLIQKSINILNKERLYEDQECILAKSKNNNEYPYHRRPQNKDNK